MTLAGRHAAVQPQVGDGGQFGFQEVLLHNVQHTLQLTENEDAVLGHDGLCTPLGASSAAEAAVQQQLGDRKQVRTAVSCC